MSSNAEIEKLKSDSRVIEVYRKFLELKRDGREWVCACPFHQDDTPSFHVNDMDGIWMWRCHGACGISGNIFQFIEKFKSVGFREAFKITRDIVGGWETDKKLVEKNFKPTTKEVESKTITLEEYRPLVVALSKSEEAIAWLRSRGISVETAIRLMVGFRTSVKSKEPEIDNSGWISFPSIVGDKVVSVKFRSIVKKAFSRRAGMATVIFNTPTIDCLEPVYVTEGEMDAIALEEAGFRAVALSSASQKLTPEEKDMIMAASEVILAGDSDQPGIEAMTRLWNDFGERTYMLQWPSGIKDANQALVEKCKSDASVFRTMVQELTAKAKATPMPHIQSLAETMITSGNTNLFDRPDRLHFPWPSVDKMAILLPGSVMVISATNTKQGKTAFVKDITMYNASKYNEVVLNYQCELSFDEFANISAAGLLEKDRATLSRDDYKRASEILSSKNAKYYIGRDQTLTTVGPVLDLIEAGIRRLGATIVVLDHIHFIARNARDEIKAQAEAMQRIKLMGQKYGCKFIVVCQPRKSDSKNKGKVIHITDLKGTEAIGSDADAIFVIHRDFISVKDAINPPKDDYDPKTEVHMLACRTKGPGNTYTELRFMGQFAKFHEISIDSPPED